MLDNIIQFANKIYDDAHHHKHIYTYYSRTLSYSGFIVDRHMNKKASIKCLNENKSYESVLIDFYTYEIYTKNEKVADFFIESVNSIKINALPGYFIYIKNKDGIYSISNESVLDLHAHVAMNVCDLSGSVENIRI